MSTAKSTGASGDQRWRRYRLSLDAPAEIIGQRLGRCIPSSWIMLERHQDDTVEIACQRVGRNAIAIPACWAAAAAALGGTIASSQTAFRIAAGESPFSRCAGRPVSSSYRTTPSEYTSDWRVIAAVPPGRGVVHEPQVRLVHQNRWLKGVRVVLPAQIAFRQAMQRAVDDGDQLVARA